MSTIKKDKAVSPGHRTIIKSVFGIDPGDWVEEDIDQLIKKWAQRVGYGHTDGVRLRYDDKQERWVTAEFNEPAHGYVKNEIFIPDGPLDGVDLAKAISKSPEEGSQDDGEVVKYCGCANPKCNLPNGVFCMNPI